MRKALLATLALSPVLLHAQANSPAQPNVTLDSRLAAPAAPAVNRATSSKPLRISTGVIHPKLVYSTPVSTDGAWAWTISGVSTTATVSMIVDAKGRPTDLKIVKSASP